MEELAVKIAELLDISVQGAIDLYPVIRSQYIWYSLCQNIGGWVMLLGVISLVSTVATFIIRKDTKIYSWRDREKINEEYTSIDKLFKISISIFILLTVIGIAMSAAIPFLAPDIVLIKDFLG